ncbi:MAG: hypothetical protein ACRELY_06770 [Polyangiaceae bacterium]
MKRIFCAALLGLCAVGIGCSSSSNEGTSPGGSDGGTGTTDGGGSWNGDISVPATDGSWPAQQDVTFTGKGAKDLGAISITHGAGTIQFKGAPAQAFFFDATPVPEGTGDAGDFSGSRDFQIIAAQDSRFIMMWITCTGTDLGFIYYESTDGDSSSSTAVPGGELAATGTCTVAETPTSVAVSLPAVTLPSAPPLVSGFTITGSDLSFDGTNPGKANVNNESWTMYPFNTVDCRDCATPGWYELHSLFYDSANQNACLGILYLMEGSPSQTELAYFLCLPALSAPLTNDQQFFDSSWTSP